MVTKAIIPAPIKTSFVDFLGQAAEKQVSQLRKERDAAQSRVEKAERGLESLGYDKAQEDGLVEEKDKEEKAVEGLREVGAKN